MVGRTTGLGQRQIMTTIRVNPPQDDLMISIEETFLEIDDHLRQNEESLLQMKFQTVESIPLQTRILKADVTA